MPTAPSSIAAKQAATRERKAADAKRRADAALNQQPPLTPAASKNERARHARNQKAADAAGAAHREAVRDVLGGEIPTPAQAGKKRVRL